MTDIFLSYASQDLARIRPLVTALESRGFSVWWDRTILAGKVWEREIEAALAASRCVIVAWSSAAIQSDWVWTEADEGKRRNVLVPVLLDPVTIPLAFRKIHAANLVNWNGQANGSQFEEVIKALTSLLGAAPAPATAPAPAPTPINQPPAEKISSGPIRGRSKPTNGRTPLLIGAGALGLILLIAAVWYFAPRPQTPATTTQAQISTVASPQTASPPAATTKIKVNPKDNLRYVWIPPGHFTMGCSLLDSECGNDEKPPHPVNITRGFWLGQTEVTQAAYTSVTAKPNRSFFKGDNNLPVENVNWEEANSYCQAVGMRLPTEAEWEYAARGGSTFARYGDLAEIAWYSDNSDHKTHPVAQKSSNAYGLYDMLGNVWEWVNDWYDPKYYDQKAANDPPGPKLSPEKSRVVRGGSWNLNSTYLRVSFRYRYEPLVRYGDIGFRCGGELP